MPAEIVLFLYLLLLKRMFVFSGPVRLLLRVYLIVSGAGGPDLIGCFAGTLFNHSLSDLPEPLVRTVILPILDLGLHLYRIFFLF